MVPMDKRPPVTTRESSKKDTLVIRLSLDKRFTEPSHWNKARQNPGALARAWMKEAAPVCGQFLQDTWGWELVPGAGGQDSVIKGLVRVKQKDQLTHLLAASGKLIQNVRFFLDPLDWSQTPSTWGKKPHISWVERRSKEDDLAYMTRAAKLNVNCGLAKGWRQIGVRSLTEPAKTPEVPVRSWVLKSAPRYWTYDQVTSFLEASQFTSVELVSKKWENLELLGFSKVNEMVLGTSSFFTAEISLMLTTASFWLRSAFSRLLGKSLKEPSSEMKNASPSAQDL